MIEFLTPLLPRLTVLFLIVAVFPIVAAAQRPVRWPTGATILVWIDQANGPPGASALVERAVATWASALGQSVALKRAAGRNDAVVRVHFASSRGLFGEARPQVDAAGAIVSADVVIATDTGGDDPTTQRIVLYLTALHELGHALGLRHTDNFADIMYSFRRPDDGERYFAAYRQRLKTAADIGSPAATGLSPNDLAAVRELYGR